MTLSEFQDMIATLPAHIDRVRFWGLNKKTPRLTWWEAYIEQTYASNMALIETTIIAVEYATSSPNDPGIEAVKKLFRDNQIPFKCEIQNDEDNNRITYLYNIQVDNDV